MKRVPTFPLFIIGILIFAVSISISSYFIFMQFVTEGTTSGEVTLADIQAFENAEEFAAYLIEAQGVDTTGAYFRSLDVGSLEQEADFIEESTVTDGALGYAPEAPPERVSSTNVQVFGIDEPDIVKTDGETIYFSSENSWYRTVPMMDLGSDVEYEEYYPPTEYTDVISAFPPQDIELTASIPNTGNLLLSDDSLMVFEYDRLYGYDVANPEIPETTWSIIYEDDTSYVTARLYNDKLYLVTQTYVYIDDPCPIVPYVRDTVRTEIACSDIYYPKDVIPADATYTISIIDPATGYTEDTISFLGTVGYTLVYMSPKNIYVTYSFTGNVANLMIDMFIANEDLFPDSLIQRFETLKTYDLSMMAKMMEISTIFEQYQQTLDEDERTRIDNEMQNRAEAYMADHIREFSSTGIVKTPVTSLEITAAGSVPGDLLNQFSLDEYDDNLRVATTVGNTWLGIGDSIESANDVYVLDDDLKEIGSVIDLGLDESIYSVRFIGRMGFVVTYKQIDPFYVIDLSDPKDPTVQGELKIPGYSSYLHPLPDYTILGIGEEDWKVKLSLFDVSDPTNPEEKDKYTLDEYWSDVSETHHAFLHDAEHSIFFMPAGSSGYIFSYEGGELSLERVVSNIQAQRAVYIEDYLYVIGDTKIVVLDENTWEDVSELELAPDRDEPILYEDDDETSDIEIAPDEAE